MSAIRRLMTTTKSFAKRHPLVSTSCLYFGLYGLGDLTQQKLAHKETITLESAGRLAFLGGCVLAPTYHFWYKFLDKMLVGASTRMVLIKLAYDTFLMFPIGLALFYIGYAILEGQKDKTKDFIEKGPKTYAVGLLFWPCVQAINFKFMPTEVRAPYVAFAAYVWSIFLASMKSATSNDQLNVGS